MVLQRKYSTPSARLEVCMFLPERPALRFAEPIWMRARLQTGLASRRFSTVAFEKLENVSGSTYNSLTHAMATNSGRNASIGRFKTFLQFRMKSREAC